MKKIAIATTLSFMLTSILVAQPNMQKNPEGMKKLAQMAGEKSPYYRTKKEAFPKDYFLVSQNLPFLVGVALFHPNSDELNLTKEQLSKLAEMKKTIVPVSAKNAKAVKSMELELAKAIVEEKKTPESQYELVDKIAKAKADMTKAHLKCINTVQNLLSDEQFKTLLKLATQKGKSKNNLVAKKSNPEAENLFKTKCASCHTMTKPTDMSNLVAPAIMGVMRHVKMSYPAKDKAVAFMKDYVLNPSESKAICMPKKIKKFGVMPSQKGVVSEAELDVILPWLYDNFPPKGFKGMGHGNGMKMR
ncbi:MAG: c-type cytochrome [Epsilonproteobacteria bacterium]|nr:c-type cytochrome [Campylobacterota bacterium]